MTDSDDISIGQEFLDSCYKNGEVYCVDYGNKDFNFMTFCLSTDFLDKRRDDPFVQKLIEKINNKMKKMFNNRIA